jgi:hypothetical protein
MIQLITTISEDIFPYVNVELTEKVNKFLLELPNMNAVDWFEQIAIENFNNQKIRTESNIKIVKLALDYEAIDYVKTLAYVFEVDVKFIYDWAYRRQIEY